MKVLLSVLPAVCVWFKALIISWKLLVRLVTSTVTLSNLPSVWVIVTITGSLPPSTWLVIVLSNLSISSSVYFLASAKAFTISSCRKS